MTRLLAAALALVASVGIAAAEVRAPGEIPEAGGFRLPPCQLQDPEHLAIFDPRVGRSIAEISAEVAATPEARERGLMNRAALPAGRGMLFIYPAPRLVAFWMKNTLIPLDMIFVDDSGVIVRVHENAVPGDETPIPSGAPVRYVLEIGGGQARALGIGPGTVLAVLRGRQQGIPLSVCGFDR